VSTPSTNHVLGADFSHDTVALPEAQQERLTARFLPTYYPRSSTISTAPAPSASLQSLWLCSKQSAHAPLRPSPPCLCMHGALSAAHQRMLFSRSRLRERVRPPVYRLGGSSLAASCQPAQRPLLRRMLVPALLLCVAPERALLWQESGTGRVQPLPEGARAPCTRLHCSIERSYCLKGVHAPLAPGHTAGYRSGVFI
jgi:hypothetical protein